MKLRTRRQLAAPLVAIFVPWRLRRGLDSEGRLPIVLAALAGLLVIPIIEVTFTVVEHCRARHDIDRLNAPQAALMVELVDGITGRPGLPAATVAVRVVTWIASWLIGGLGSGLLTCAMLWGLLRLLTIGAGMDARATIRPGAGAMTWWLAVATQAFALGAISRTAGNPTLFRAGAACIGVWTMVGAGIGTWSMMRQSSRARAVVGAIVLGLLVVPVAAIGMQLAWQSLLLWQGLHP